MNDKKTAVEWLSEHLVNEMNFDYWSAIEKALQMEKQQIIDAFVECWEANMPDGFECKLSAKQYYNENYKSE